MIPEKTTTNVSRLSDNAMYQHVYNTIVPIYECILVVLESKGL